MKTIRQLMEEHEIEYWKSGTFIGGIFRKGREEETVRYSGQSEEEWEADKRAAITRLIMRT